jgi:ribonuclease-3
MAGAGREQLEALLGHKFKSPERLERALTHSSWLGENPATRGSSGEEKSTVNAGEPGADQAVPAYDGNEKLEFLGDAVLTLVVSESLLAGYPSWREGQLSKARASLVNAGALAEAARRLDLGAYLRLGRGEEKSGGRFKPALLADAYEAVVAALYLDGGLNAVRSFVERSLLSTAMDGQVGHLGEADHKSRLQEMLQARGWPSADYRVVNEIGPDHRKTFEVEARVTGHGSATGSGLNKKEAEQAAARDVMLQIFGKGDSNEETNG